MPPDNPPNNNPEQIRALEAIVRALQDMAPNFGSFIGCRVTRSSNQSIANNTGTSIDWGSSEDFDTSGMHDPSSDTTRITIQEDGVYAVGYNFAFTTTANGDRRKGYILINNATVLAAQEGDKQNTTSPQFSTTEPYEFVAGDYIELQVFQDSGGSLNCTGAAMWAYKIGEIA